MSVCAWLVVGVVCGLLSHRIWAHEGPMVDVLFGVAGALVAGVASAHVLSAPTISSVSLASLPTVLIGAGLVLVLARVLVGRRAPLSRTGSRPN